MDGNTARKILYFPMEQNKKINNEEVLKKVKSNKKVGVKSEVYPFEIEDAKKILNYFYEQQAWQCYLIFVIQCNTARRIGDIIHLQWKHFFNPKTGKLREEMLEFKEEKTDKIASPVINSACKDAIRTYIENTGLDPAADYEDFVFVQTKGNYKGRVLTVDGYRKQLKKAAVEVGIEYNVGTHSARKFFGKMSRVLHPGDCNSMELLQTIYNHSDTKTTERYIGLTKEKVHKYYDDMGTLFADYVVGDKVYDSSSDAPIISVDVNDLRDAIAAAYKAGQENAEKKDAMIHINAINEIMSMIESFTK